MTAPFAPTWLSPAAPGQLSNKRGSNTTGDALSLQVKYANPKATGDFAGSIRVIASRSVVGGVTQPTQVIQDSGWTGVPATSPLPLVPAAAVGQFSPNCCAVYQGRVYAISNVGGITISNGAPAHVIYSAAISGANVSPWRLESTVMPPVLSAPDSLPNGEVGAMSIINGRMYIAFRSASTLGVATPGANNIYFSTIQADGTLGPWTATAGPNTNPGALGGGRIKTVTMIGYGDSTVAWILYFYNNTSFVAPVSLVDGSVGAWVASTAPPTNAVGLSGLVYSRFHGKLFMVGGGTTTVPVTTVWTSPVTAGTGAVGAFTANATGIPSARSAMGIASFGDLVGTATATVYIIGGNSGSGLTPSSTVYSITTANINAGNVAWTTGTSISTLVADNAAFPCGQQSVDGTSANFLFYVGTTGTTGASTPPTAVGSTTQPGNNAAFNSGPSSGLTAAILQTGGAITNNVEGTQSITFVYSAFGQTPVQSGGFGDGDQVTLTVQFTDLNGDASPSALTVVKIGQPPTVSGIVATANDGRPNISFNYSAGGGGDLEFSWRVQVAPNGFDSGIRYDSVNSLVMLTAPYLATAVQQTITVTVVSRDSPMTGSLATATVTTNFTPTLVAPGTPTVLTATPNHATGSVTLAWTNNAPAGTTPGNRVYYRRNGTVPWFLLIDAASAITTITVLDQLAAAVAYDFAVSQVDNASHSESPLSNIVLNVTINPVVGGWSGFIHVQGTAADQSGPNAHQALLLVQNSPNVNSIRDTTATLPFQQLTPVVTLGVAHYAKFSVTILVPTLANQKAIIDVLTTAYLGGVIIYRDGFGAMVACQIDPDQSAKYKPPVARELNLTFTQIPNQFSASTVQGVATGYQQQSFGSIIPLDPSEAVL